MYKYLSVTYLNQCVAKIFFFVLLCSAGAVQANKSVDTLTLSFKKGQVLQLIAPVNLEGKESVRRHYYQTAIPLAESYGFANLGQLSVTQKIVGDFEPGAFVIGSWPSVKSFDDFAALPEWPELKQQRAQGWEELKLYNDQVEKDLELVFRQSKFYTVAFAWFNPENPNDYLKYLKSIEGIVNQMGGKFIHKMRSPTLEAHNSPKIAPDQITFVEWDSEDGLKNLLAHPEYEMFSGFFKSGISKFEMFRIAPNV